MKAILAGFSLAFLLSPAFALADDATPPPPPPDAQRQAMRQLHQQAFAQMKALHTKERSAALASLSPAHRQLLANIVGQLAISPNPNANAAAAQLNASLTPAEVKSLSRIQSDLRTKMMAMHKSMRAQMEARMPADEKARMDARRAQMGASAKARSPRGMRAPADAGHFLLMLASPHGGPGGPGMEPMGGRMPMHGPGHGGMPQ